jgi:hypothetical protein
MISTNVDKSVIFSQCVFDVDNRYVDLSLLPAFGDSFMLSMTDTSNDEQYDTEIEIFLTRENLKKVIDRLTEALNEPTNSRTC